MGLFLGYSVISMPDFFIFVGRIWTKLINLRNNKAKDITRKNKVDVSTLDTSSDVITKHDIEVVGKKLDALTSKISERFDDIENRLFSIEQRK